ncbi:hypothetical protein BCR42DRAFT_398809 [Absidia repens]|uniref:Uncharacterized protein n=1 Tax=Absidia repens TaxID=90262 RepID=A0A1X2HX45_9FUNG|nr:hypothetical protein BCR42DRAFT_398809 [Absidia repens]
MCEMDIRRFPSNLVYLHLHHTLIRQLNDQTFLEMVLKFKASKNGRHQKLDDDGTACNFDRAKDAIVTFHPPATMNDNNKNNTTFHHNGALYYLYIKPKEYFSRLVVEKESSQQHFMPPNPELLKRLAIIQENNVPTTVDVVYIAFFCQKSRDMLKTCHDHSIFFLMGILVENKCISDHGLNCRTPFQYSDWTYHLNSDDSGFNIY